MAAQTLDKGSDHDKHVRSTENLVRAIDRTRGNFSNFQLAFVSVEKCQELRHMLNLDQTARDSLDALFMQQKMRLKATGQLFDNILSRHDRFLNLVR